MTNALIVAGIVIYLITCVVFFARLAEVEKRAKGVEERVKNVMGMVGYVARANLRGEIVDDSVLEKLANSPKDITIFDFAEEFQEVIEEVKYG